MWIPPSQKKSENYFEFIYVIICYLGLSEKLPLVWRPVPAEVHVRSGQLSRGLCRVPAPAPRQLRRRCSRGIYNIQSTL